jgi:hypothetical protein
MAIILEYEKAGKVKKIEKIDTREREERLEFYKDAEIICLSQFAFNTQTPFKELIKTLKMCGKADSLIYLKLVEGIANYEIRIRKVINKKKLAVEVVDSNTTLSTLENCALSDKAFVVLKIDSNLFDDQYKMIEKKLKKTHYEFDVLYHAILYLQRDMDELKDPLEHTINRMNNRFEYLANLRLFSVIGPYKIILKKTFNILKKYGFIPDFLVYDNKYEVVVADYILSVFQENVEEALDFSVKIFFEEE